MTNVLQSPMKVDRMDPVVRDGSVFCPACDRMGRKSKLLDIPFETKGENVWLYCRHCKARIKVHIKNGQCFRSPS